MWLGQTAIPSIPAHARVPLHAIETAADQFGDDGLLGPEPLRLEFRRFEREQPALADWVTRKLDRSLDEVVRGLGMSLTLTLWRAFKLTVGERLSRLSRDDCEAAELLLRTDEDLRRNDPKVVIETDDIIAAHQPDIAAFVRDEIQETIHQNAGEIDVDDMDAVYRMLLIQILALSYGIAPPRALNHSHGERLS